jgi:hydroxyacylglutathione hydrolase
MAIEIRQFACLSDNYGFLVRDLASGAVAAIDTPDAAAINTALESAGWRLTHILNTHWHPDHAGGNLALKARWGCRIVAPRAEAARIAGADDLVADNDVVSVGAARARVIDAPGHTLGHCIYHFREDHAAFVGDVIFAMGCGRLFEGTPAQMWSSLMRIAALPEQTMLYCAHEYTQANARFAESIFSDPPMAERIAAIDAARARRVATVPMRLSEELATNPFLRARHAGTGAMLGMNGATPAEVFAELRRRKDNF